MRTVVIMRSVLGVEIWQVYSEKGYHGQRWSQAYADQLAARVAKGEL